MNTRDKRERAIIFIDGNNFYHGMRAVHKLTTGIGFDYGAFSKKLIGPREWVETRYYVGQVQQKGDLTRYQEQRKFLAYLEKSPYMRICLGRMESHPAKNRDERRLRRWLRALPYRNDVNVSSSIVDELKSIADTADQPVWTEKAVDVMIATDIVSMAYEKQYDVAYLVSADGDFAPAAEKARLVGRKIFAASPQHGHQLAQAVDTFISLKNREFFHGCWN
ncbi:MAG: putative NYN domain-containing protein [Arenicellales bacterium IbO2]|nr:NYN domain-containing protein [Gammaproteobacteria bacterium]MDA8021846.1 NYN domain-containing protein [Gammaproteobacteria bacterium]MDA8032451.1 NYN domain-containing protein [Alphaproteobacteria bacterium]CAJ2375758.1 MAG: putative NYN domain-containing protein [Arenicellales bacterium IbO2]